MLSLLVAEQRETLAVRGPLRMPVTHAHTYAMFKLGSAVHQSFRKFIFGLNLYVILTWDSSAGFKKPTSTVLLGK